MRNPTKYRGGAESRSTLPDGGRHARQGLQRAQPRARRPAASNLAAPQAPTRSLRRALIWLRGWDEYALRLVAATAFAVLVPLLLADVGLAHSIDDQMTAVGFDTERVQLIKFALIALVGAVGAGVVLRWRLPVWLGALL